MTANRAALDALLAARLEGLSTHEPFARAVGSVNWFEGTWRRTTERALTGWLGAWGLSTPAERRRAEEAAFAPGSAARRSLPVHWQEAGAGPTLLLLNGWTASGLAWPSTFVRPLEDRYRVVRIDNRGTGWSRSAPTPFTIADMADDAAGVLRSAGAPSATVLGLSMGGMIAQELALRHPEMVERLILVATRPPAPRQIAPARGVLAAVMAAPTGPVREHLRRTWAASCAPGFADEHPELLEELLEQILARVTPSFAVQVQARAVAGWAGAHRLARIGAPTTVVHGAVDPLMPVGNGMRLAQLISGARYVELPGVGHIVPMEATEALLDVTR